MKYYVFRYLGKGDASYTAVFDARIELNEDELASELKSFHDHNGVSQNLIYIYPNLKQEVNEIIEIIAGAANMGNNEIQLAPYNSSGIVENNEIISECLYEGTSQIIRNRNLILQSDSTFHYVNPSNKHSPFFIRAGNILDRNEEINFIALQLLKYFHEDLSEIRCDTASVLILMYAMNYLKSLFSEQVYIPFSTFNSYTNIASIRKGSLVMISASSSGGLEDKIFKEQPDCRVVTLIFNSENIQKPNSQGEREFIFNINSIFKELITGTSSSKQYRLEECDYCNNNSIPVVVRSDQFIPSRVIVQETIIRTHQVPDWLKNAIEDLTCQNLIYAHRSESLVDKIREIFIDLKQLFLNPDNNAHFITRFNKFIKNFVPASIDLIIYLNDSSSKLLADQIHSYVQKRRNINIREPISSELLSSFQEEASTILIVGACVSNGNRLNAISRILRKFENSSVHYFIGIIRLASPTLSRILQSNLELRQNPRELNKIHFLYEFYLPNHNSKRFKTYEKSPWVEEIKFLEKAHSSDVSYTHIIDKRLAEITPATGLLENLFYPNPFDGKPLKLRPNFALHDFKDKHASQADVYFIFAGIFHALRNPALFNKRKDDDKFLIQHEHVKSLLKPDNFTRFNDGIIQACMLRLTFPAELDYSIGEEFSTQMLVVLKTILKKSDLESSEAVVEFLYALAIHKLKLVKAHEIDLINYLRGEFVDIPIIDFFLDKIDQTLNKSTLER